ncbi:MAG: diguanylate cyclase [Nitrospirota bacterium]|nr:diguanylate cyclase [Nitrospirota bacterium]MDE3244065.1 diguanylate cyclase [Nitrospirota bacterium]
MKATLLTKGFNIQELMDASPAIISLIDTEQWTVQYQNQSGQALLGQIGGKTCYENIPKQPTNCAFCRATEALRTGKTTSAEVPMPGGQWLLVQWAPIRSKDNVLSVVETITDVTETKKREEEYRALKDRFERLASIDPLTGLLNRRGWTEKAERICRRAAHDSAAVGVLIVDIDHFKRVNDTWGHSAGDHILKEVSGLLLDKFRPCDAIGRWGGEEFIVLLPPPVQDLHAAAERVRSEIESASIRLPDCADAVPITISLGGTMSKLAQGEIQELDLLIRIADQMLYTAKASGRNKVCLI